MSKQYRVYNEGPSITIAWDESILPEKEYQEWMAFKTSPEYKKPINPDLPNPNDRTRLDMWVRDRQLGSMIAIPVSKVRPTGGAEWGLSIPSTKNVTVDTKSILVVNERQKEGLKRYGKRAIEQNIKYGQTKPDYHYEGFLVFEEVKEGENLKNVDTSLTSTEEPKKKFTCEECGDSFDFPMHLAKHKKVIHG